MLSETDHRPQLRRAVIASTVGTTIQWHDFLLYGIVTGLVFGKLFFPKSDPLVGVLEPFAVYTGGFIARPIGAAFFGHFGDRIGRKRALIATLSPTGPRRRSRRRSSRRPDRAMRSPVYLLFCAIVATALMPDLTNRDISQEHA